MSTLEVKIVRVEIFPHDNADKLEIARVGGEGGYSCVVGKGQFINNAIAIYLPPDSMLPQEMLNKLQTNSKIKMDERIRPVKIRGYYSEGLCLVPSDWLEEKDIVFDKDVKDILGIKKYEPPAPSFISSISSKGTRPVTVNHPHFMPYNDVEHLKKHPQVLTEGEEVIVEIKTHGTNARYGYVKKTYRNIFQKYFCKWILRESDWEFLVGSHEKVKKLGKKRILAAKAAGYDIPDDTWWKIAKQYDLEKICWLLSKNYDGKSVAIYGEIYGPGIQKGYQYGVPEGELRLKVFDIKVDGKALDYKEMRARCLQYDLPIWEPCYCGPFSHAKIHELTDDVIDEYGGKKYNREGTVTRPVKERRDARCGRVILKLINPKYALDKTNSDNH